MAFIIILIAVHLNLPVAYVSPMPTAATTCQTIHGRLHFYGGDGDMWLWHIGTHHTFTPDNEETDATAMRWLMEGTSEEERKEVAAPASAVFLYGNFEVCPTEPLRKGWVQRAKFVSVSNRRYAHLPLHR